MSYTPTGFTTFQGITVPLHGVNDAVRARQAVEVEIVLTFCAEAIKAGYWLNFNNGGEGYELKRPTNDLATMARELFATDEEYVYLFSNERARKHSGWARFVYGESGWDVVCDYQCTEAVEAVMVLVDIVSDRRYQKAAQEAAQAVSR